MISTAIIDQEQFVVQASAVEHRLKLGDHLSKVLTLIEHRDHYGDFDLLFKHDVFHVR